MSCCQGYKIKVDPQTLQNWQDHADPEESRDLLANIVHIEPNQVNMLQRDDGTCACLGPDKLCTVQVRHGHDLLPQICRDYPRSILESDWKRLETLLLSCPEATRLTLFNDNDSPLFEPIGERARGTYRQVGYTSTSQLIDEFVDGVLQNSKYPLNVKVLAISTLLAQLSMLFGQVQLDQNAFDGLFKKVGSRLYELNLAIKQGKIKPAPPTRGSYWKSIYRLTLKKAVSLTKFNLNDSAWHRLLSECQDIEGDLTKIDNKFAAYRNSAWAALHDNYGKLFLRYLTITFCNQGFPWRSPSGFIDILAAFIHCVTKLSAIQLICLIKQHETGSLEEECLYELIYTVEHQIGHSDAIYETIKKDPMRRNLHLYQECFIDFF